MTQQHQRKTRGFTIIEVMIVLAIAGLIMLMVFLAVPALERSSRNTQRRNDVTALLGAMSEYANNNGGVLPGSVNIIGNAAYFCASGTCSTTNGTPVNLGYYNSGTISIATSAPAAVPDNDTVVILKGFTCANNGPVPASARSYVAYFSVEPNTTAQCQG